MTTSMFEDLSKLDPQFIAFAEDQSIGLKGYVVVDRTINNHACGGLRMVPDLTIDELKGLARSMTLKYGFSHMDQGGAKAGIVADYNLSAGEKEILLRRFGEIISPLLKTGYYITGTDINTSKQEIMDMLDHCRVHLPSGRRNKGNKSGFFTALSVMVASEAAAFYKNLSLTGCSIAIEGFGAVGSAYGWLMAKKHEAKIVAVSSLYGAVYNAKGLDIDMLMKLKDKYRDELVNHYPEAEKISPAALFTLPVDILSPCARHFSINRVNAPDIKAGIVCPGANNPVTPEADEILQKRHIVSIPPFIANCGGVIGNKIEITGLGDDFIENYIRKRNTPKIISLIKKADELQVPLFGIAEQEAMENFKKMQIINEKNFVKRKLVQQAKKIVNSSLLPGFISRKIGGYYFSIVR
ncbi:MAG: Glu/Leu/Phe/Val dehydrogenase [Bacteroidales bacterium]|nr:Glu/Leu/Phe/Val dehydrogenase [Bacteroidales bacterium]